MMSGWGVAIEAVERGWAPDFLTRRGIRRLCGVRLQELRAAAASGAESRFIESMRTGPVAPVPEKANEQHYELPAEFFELALGPHRKYSSCFWPDADTTLGEAEAAALEATCQRARLADGQQILELGCGWGSLSLWMAQRYPGSRITAVSNSTPQRQFIEAAARRQGLDNLRVVTADINAFAPDARPPFASRFDRVVSVEMFEHLRNYQEILRRVAEWLEPDGKLFLHIFCHRSATYPFETEGDDNWMGRYFFTGGIMPGAGLLQRFDRHLQVVGHWTWNGRHYQRTAEAWLENLDRQKSRAMEILTSNYGPAEALRWYHRWRLFFLAVAELFGYADGEEWFVSHYLLEPRR